MRLRGMMRLHPTAVLFVAQMMAHICERPNDANRWRREAELLWRKWIDLNPDAAQMQITRAMVSMIDRWQHERAQSNNDFPLSRKTSN